MLHYVAVCFADTRGQARGPTERQRTTMNVLGPAPLLPAALDAAPAASPPCTSAVPHLIEEKTLEPSLVGRTQQQAGGAAIDGHHHDRTGERPLWPPRGFVRSGTA